MPPRPSLPLIILLIVGGLGHLLANPHDLRAERAQTLATYTDPATILPTEALKRDGFNASHECAATSQTQRCLQVSSDSRLYDISYRPTGNGGFSTLTVVTYDVSNYDSVWGKLLNRFVDVGCDGTNDELSDGFESEQQSDYEATVRSILAILNDPAIN